MGVIGKPSDSQSAVRRTVVNVERKNPSTVRICALAPLRLKATTKRTPGKMNTDRKLTTTLSAGGDCIADKIRLRSSSRIEPVKRVLLGRE